MRLLALFTFLGLGAAVASSAIREDELQCEEAIAHVVSCCPGFAPEAVDCSRGEGCEVSEGPTLDAAEGRCVRARSCSELRDDGLCERERYIPGTPETFCD